MRGRAGLVVATLLRGPMQHVEGFTKGGPRRHLDDNAVRACGFDHLGRLLPTGSRARHESLNDANVPSRAVAA